MTQNLNTSVPQNTGFLSAIFDKLSNAVCVVNADLEVTYFNQKFVEIFGPQGGNIIGKRFGVSIGCKGHENKFSNGICNNCKLRLAMQATIISGQDQEKESIVLEMGDQSVEEVRLIQFQSNYMIHEDKKYAVVILNDLTGMGKETLNFINDFYAAQD